MPFSFTGRQATEEASLEESRGLRDLLLLQALPTVLPSQQPILLWLASMQVIHRFYPHLSLGVNGS